MALTLQDLSIVPAEDLHRAYSFTDHSTYQPGTPQPGDRIDAELDRIYAVLSDLSALLAAAAQPRPIALTDLAPGVIDQITNAVQAGVQSILSQVQGTAANAIAQADRANSEATRAATYAQSASAAVANLDGTEDQVQQALADVLHVSDTLDNETIDAENAASDAEDAANRARRDQELAGAWAEWMPDPIPPRFFPDEAISGNHWSARWWAAEAANAFGALTALYQGALPAPPTTTITGQPLPVGAIYYDTTSQQPYVWNGSAWVPFYAPTKALMLTLLYRAVANVVAWQLSLPDLNNQHYTVNPTNPEPLDVYLNGIRVPRDAPVSGDGNGDWDFNPANNTITFIKPLLAGTLVQIDILAPPSSLSPSQVITRQLQSFPVDGTTATFPLKLAAGGASVTVASPVELFISIDGVIQQPGADYNTTGSNITFGEAPQAGARSWGLWFGPGSST